MADRARRRMATRPSTAPSTVLASPPATSSPPGSSPALPPKPVAGPRCGRVAPTTISRVLAVPPSGQLSRTR
ncbi:hypothetical protein [Plantactinospora veratri]